MSDTPRLWRVAGESRPAIVATTRCQKCSVWCALVGSWKRSLTWDVLLQEQVRRLEMLCEAERETLPEEAQRQLADAGLALTKALEECRAVLRQNRQVRGPQPQRTLPH